ncbi:MAG TPA: DUF2306 domain-containing protein [Sphingomicrobium sp.]|nr:DUF2306 domain-containing protein [Sphingomicrobium sp.]
MATTAEDRPRPRSLWATRNGVILAAALISSVVTWWLIAWPSLTLATAARHGGHFAGTYAHVLGGTGMLLFGGLNLYLAARRDNFPLHRLVGRTYLAFGVFGAVSSLFVTLSMAHKDAGSALLTNETISLVTLAFAWLAFAGLGWRAARNRRFPSHGQWMIRSYVLAWAFVFCRIGSRLADLDELGGGEAFIWLSWVAPMILCEIVLQWPEGARKAARTARDSPAPL